MNKMFLAGVLVLVGTCAYAALQKQGIISAATVSSLPANGNHVNGTADATIVAAGAGIRNCLDTLDVIAAGNYTIRVLDGGTTIYALSLQANQGLVRDWTEDQALCGTANTALSIKVTTSTAGDYNINYKGFTY